MSFRLSLVKCLLSCICAVAVGAKAEELQAQSPTVVAAKSATAPHSIEHTARNTIAAVAVGEHPLKRAIDLANALPNIGRTSATALIRL